MMERTLALRHDLDWLPPRYRAIRWTIAGSIWTAMAGGIGAVMIFGHGIGALGGMFKGLAALGAGGYYAGDRAARSRRRDCRPSPTASSSTSPVACG